MPTGLWVGFSLGPTLHLVQEPAGEEVGFWSAKARLQDWHEGSGRLDDGVSQEGGVCGSGRMSHLGRTRCGVWGSCRALDPLRCVKRVGTYSCDMPMGMG